MAEPVVQSSPQCLEFGKIESIASGQAADAVALEHLGTCATCRDALWEVEANLRLLGRLRKARESGDDGVSPVGTLPENLIQGYRLLEEINRGSQGVVYRAVQERTKRIVAIKMLLGGSFASSKQRARFEREIEIAASLNHPGIVTIYDNTPVRGGRFAYAMEYIEGGVPLGVWAVQVLGDDRERVRAKLTMAATLCDAVHYAHQRGVIHRDLKPANILVDAHSNPHVLDFGIARYTAADHVNWTLTLEFAGTLAYASPEQIAGRADGIDVRTDVYSLGVIVFEMLTGRLPHVIDGQSIAETVRLVTEQDAPRLASIDKFWRGDLDTILAKVLERDATRRYQSAAALAAEIRRHLAGQSIEARRNSSWYVLRKAATRHKAAVLGASAFILTLIVSLVVSITFALQARDARDELSGTLKRESGLLASERDAREGERRALELEKERSMLLERQAYEGQIFAAQEALAAMDAAGVVESLTLASKAPVALRGWEWNFLNAQVDYSKSFISAVLTGVFDGDVSADGRWAVTRAYQGHVVTWDLTHASPIEHGVRSWSIGEGSGLCAAISPDGRLIAAADTNHAVHLMEHESGSVLPVQFRHATRVRDIDFTPDGRRLITACDNGSRWIWNVQTGESRLIREPWTFFWGGRKMAHDVALSLDGKRLITAFANGWIVAREVESGEHLWQKRADNRAVDAAVRGDGLDVDSIAVSDDALIVASGHRDGVVRLWHGDTGQSLGVLPGHRDRVQALQFVPNSHNLLAGSDDGRVLMWDTDSKSLKREFFGLTDAIVAIACTRTGPPALLAFSINNTARLWRLDAPPPVRTAAHDGKAVRGMAFSGESNTLWTVADDIALRSWDVDSATLQSTETWIDLPAGLVTDAAERAMLALRGVAASPLQDGDLVAATNAAGAVLLWKNGRRIDMLSRPFLQTLGEPSPPVFYRGGRSVFVNYWQWDEAAAVSWDLDREKPIARLVFHLRGAEAATISPDGRYVAILIRKVMGQSAGEVVIISSEEPERVLGRCDVLFERQESNPAPIMSFSPDSSLLAVPSLKDVVLVDVLGCKRLHTCRGHTGDVSSARFSPDGSRIVSASQDTTVRLWDTATGERRLILRKHEQGVLDAGFSPDGRVIVSCGKDGQAIVWDSRSRRVESAPP
ncbi:MAG: WD40 repeat domain-containing serine/threonine protein kinase [Vicinamibacterales bacterium]